MNPPPSREAVSQALNPWVVWIPLSAGWPLALVVGLPTSLMLLIGRPVDETFGLWLMSTAMVVVLAGIVVSSFSSRKTALTLGPVTAVLGGVLWLLATWPDPFTAIGWWAIGVVVSAVLLTVPLGSLVKATPPIGLATLHCVVGFRLASSIVKGRIMPVDGVSHALLTGAGLVGMIGVTWLVFLLAQTTASVLCGRERVKLNGAGHGKIFERKDILWITPAPRSPLVGIRTTRGWYFLLGPSPGEVASGGGGWDVLDWVRDTDAAR